MDSMICSPNQSEDLAWQEHHWVLTRVERWAMVARDQLRDLKNVYRNLLRPESARSMFSWPLPVERCLLLDVRSTPLMMAAHKGDVEAEHDFWKIEPFDLLYKFQRWPARGSEGLCQERS